MDCFLVHFLQCTENEGQSPFQFALLFSFRNLLGNTVFSIMLENIAAKRAPKHVLQCSVLFAPANASKHSTILLGGKQTAQNAAPKAVPQLRGRKPRELIPQNARVAPNPIPVTAPINFHELQLHLGSASGLTRGTPPCPHCCNKRRMYCFTWTVE